MSASSSQRRIRQRTDEGVAASRTKIANRLVIPEYSSGVLHSSGGCAR